MVTEKCIRLPPLVLCLAVLPSTARAAVIYVDQTLAVDCADCTPAARSCGAGEQRVFAALEPGLSSLQPGDTLYLRAGRDGQLNPAASATPAEPIEIRGAPGESVTITSSGQVALWLVDRSYIRIADIAVTGARVSGDWRTPPESSSRTYASAVPKRVARRVR
jgi:hypothetical protein